MLETIDPLDYMLAIDLGKSLGEVRAMPNRDFAEWSAFYTYRSEMEKLHASR